MYNPQSLRVINRTTISERAGGLSFQPVRRDGFDSVVRGGPKAARQRRCSSEFEFVVEGVDGDEGSENAGVL